MYREERDFYEMAVGKPGVVPKHIEQLHEKVSGILHKLSPGRLHVQTLALIAALAQPEKPETSSVKPKNKPPHAKRTA